MLVWRWFRYGWNNSTLRLTHLDNIFALIWFLYFRRYLRDTIPNVCIRLTKKMSKNLIFLCFFCEFCIFLLLCEYVWVITFRKWTSRWQKRCVKFFRHVDINILRFWCFWVNFSEMTSLIESQKWLQNDVTQSILVRKKRTALFWTRMGTRSLLKNLVFPIFDFLVFLRPF